MRASTDECPRLIYCSVTGFGQDGPYAKRAGYDLMAQGMGGIMDLTGMPDGEPTRIGIPIVRHLHRRYSVVGILAALARTRDAPARARYVDTALVDSTVGVLSNQALNYLVSGKVPKRIGNAHANIVPYQVFPAADGYVIVATGNDTQYVKFCNVLGAPELGAGSDLQGQCRPAQPSRGADRQAVRTDREDEARRSARTSSKTQRRAGRADQRSRAGVRRSAGDRTRHEARSCRARRRKAARSPACARRS